MIDHLVGKRSLGDCTVPQMLHIRAEVNRLNPKPKGPRTQRRKGPRRAGGRALAPGAVQAKLRALWISGYHLGVVRDASEAALVAMVRRVTGGAEKGRPALEWLTAEDGNKAVEGLKDMLARDGGVSWESYRVVVDGESRAVERPRARVLEAIWRRLHDVGEVQIRDYGALAAWCCRHITSRNARSHTQLSDQESDRCIEALGRWLRRALAKRGEAAAS